MRQQQEPTLAEQAVLLVAVLVVVYGFAALVLSLERPNAPQAPAVTGNGSQPHPSSPSQPAALLSHPIGYDATIRQCLPSGRKCTPTRYYVYESKRHAR